MPTPSNSTYPLGTAPKALVREQDIEDAFIAFVFNSDFNCGEFAIIEQDALATLKPIEIERFGIIETIEVQP